ncbi:hypothetical protein Tco_0026305 [Tanacetum coccineum]
MWSLCIVAEAYEWDEEEVSSDDNEIIEVNNYGALGEDLRKGTQFRASIKTFEEYVSDNLYAVSIKKIWRIRACTSPDTRKTQDPVRRIQDLYTLYSRQSKRIFWKILNVCMTWSSNKDLVQPLEEPECVFQSSRNIKTTSLDSSSLLVLDLITKPENQFEEEVTETMTDPIMEDGLEHEDPNEHIEKVLEIADLFHILKLSLKCPQHYLTDMQEVIAFYKGLDAHTRQILDSRGAIHTMKAADAKKAIHDMAVYS